MFESQVAYYLDRYLGRYVAGLDAAALRISVWSGDVVLTNLALKPEALEELGLPVAVVSGVLGKLTLKVSWSWRARFGTCRAQALHTGACTLLPGPLLARRPAKPRAMVP